MAAKNINVRELRDLIESKKPVLVDFWATWCPHCRKINPAYEQIAEEYAGRLEVVKVDVDQDETLWEELELIPTLRLYMEGKPVDSIVAPQSKAAIEAFLAGVMPKEKKATEKHLYDTIMRVFVKLARISLPISRDRIDASRSQHRKVLDAIEQQDAEAARKFMLEHKRDILSSVRQYQFQNIHLFK